MRKPGSNVRLIMRSACTSRILDEAKPPSSASRTRAGSAPARDANSRASATASMFSATMIWLATLAVWPSPLPPTRVMFLPMRSNSGLTRANTSSGPPTMMDSVAFLAPTSPPETGASRYWAPMASMRRAKSLVATGEMELMSTTTLPLLPLRPAATPSSPNSTFSTSGVSGSIRKMMSARSATPRAVVHWVALLSAICAGILPRVFTKSWWPAARRWPAMGAPMMPRPTKPSLREDAFMLCTPCRF